MYFLHRNRCFSCPTPKGPYLCFATSSSLYTQSKTAKSTYVDGNTFKDNKTKRGSGGNSYAGYLARRVGELKCSDCNVKCDNK